MIDDSAPATFEERRTRYVREALRHIPRILASVDLNPFGPSYGCCDRQYWHYRTAAFPSEMYQEAALPLALAYRHQLPGNRWHGEVRLAEAATAILRFSLRSAHRDGSCDDYYPHERALGAAVFSLQAATEAYRLLELRDDELLRFFTRRARWIAEHDEAGRLTNHHALAALALWRTADLTGDDALRGAALERVRQVVAWQSSEGWFPEYGGADPGYQTVTIDCLAKLRRLAQLDWLDEPLEHAVEFCRWFMQPDGSYGGVCGSRGTRHFYPHGMELLAQRLPAAARLADGFLASLEHGTAAQFDDDRMYVHRVGNLIEAYLDTSPRADGDNVAICGERWFPAAKIFVSHSAAGRLSASLARGGSFQFIGNAETATPLVDAGLVVELNSGLTAVSQTHDLKRTIEVRRGSQGEIESLAVAGSLEFVRFERVTPWKQAVLHLAATSLGGFGRDLIRRALQKRVIHGRRQAPISLHRSWVRQGGRWRVVDTIVLDDPQVEVRRMAFAGEFQAAYTAATSIYHDAILQPWRDLGEFVFELNERRTVRIVRELSGDVSRPQRMRAEDPSCVVA